MANYYSSPRKKGGGGGGREKALIPFLLKTYLALRATLLGNVFWCDKIGIGSFPKKIPRRQTHFKHSLDRPEEVVSSLCKPGERLFTGMRRL